MNLAYVKLNELDELLQILRHRESLLETNAGTETIAAQDAVEQYLNSLSDEKVAEIQALAWHGQIEEVPDFEAQLTYSKARLDKTTRHYLATKLSLRADIEKGLLNLQATNP